MAKSYKKKRELEEVIVESDTLSKKEKYDLEKQKKMILKEKEQKKKDKSIKKKINNKTKGTNMGAKIFAVVMLLLMVGSVIVSTLAYIIQ